MDRPPLLILGASARAAAASAARAGFAPMAVDLFADRDLAALGPAHRIDRDDYPGGLADLAARMPEAPWIYTGGLENHPDLIDRIARDRPLLGIGGEALRAVRDPARWTEALRQARLPALPCVVSGEGPSEPGAWLLKPKASAGGQGIGYWSPGMGTIPEGWYVQAIALGDSFGATFVGDGGSARLVGVAEQEPSGSGRGVVLASYAGSIGPCRLEGRAWDAIGRIGEALAAAFGLRGLFGVDVILDRDTPWPVEINPRYTASCEVLEEGLGVSLIAEHARAFGAGAGLPPRPSPTEREGRDPASWSSSGSCARRGPRSCRRSGPGAAPRPSPGRRSPTSPRPARSSARATRS